MFLCADNGAESVPPSICKQCVEFSRSENSEAEQVSAGSGNLFSLFPLLAKKTYNDSMDDRKKQIGELERARKNNQSALDSLLRDLGNALLSRPEIDGADAAVFPEIEEFHCLRGEITAAEASIVTVETRIARQRILEDDIESKEIKDNACSKELAGFYAKLGKLALEHPALQDFAAAYRGQADVLIPKVQSLEERLAGLSERTEGGNVFTWIGKGAQGMVLRSFLTKAADNLERLYRNAGEQFYKAQVDNISMDKSVSAEIADLGVEIEKNRDLAQSLSEELSKLREEHRQIGEEFGAAGGPVKQIQSLKKQIAHVKGTLDELYLRFGQAAFGKNLSEDGEFVSRSDALEFLINSSDKIALDEAERLRQEILGDGESIRRIQAAIDIDEELETIEKLRGLIAEKNVRITETRRSIAEFENRIKDAEKRIDELRELL